jgi:hypothetical protein
MAVAAQGAVLRLVSPQAMVEQEAAAAAQAQREAQNVEDMMLSGLAHFVRGEWQIMRDHRDRFLTQRLLAAMRQYKGEYDPEKLREIEKFGGSKVFARLTAAKCRGVTSLLRDVYLGPDRPWGVDPTPIPTLPEDIMAAVDQLIQSEIQQQMQMGGPAPDQPAMMQRRVQLLSAAAQASTRQARERSKDVEKRIDDLLHEGDFYIALAEMLTDLPIFPFAVLKGPVVRNVADVRWENGQAVVNTRSRMFWERVSPFDFYRTPGVSRIEDAAVCQRIRMTRAALNQCLGLPGFRADAIRQVLDDYGRGGLTDWLEFGGGDRALLENREDPHLNRSGLIDAIEYHGPVQGRLLQEFGMGSMHGVIDAMVDYHVTVWLIGRHVIKVLVNPNPRHRHPFYVTSFEKLPGSVEGHGAPEILADTQDVANATLRALVNNLSIASGPQVYVNTDRIAPGADVNNLYPWKIWHVISDEMGRGSASDPPVSFFSPSSNANELLGVYEKMTQIADETSAIPRYLSGSERTGGAGRTASGLAMLMGNASKVLQNVAANIDRDVLHPALQSLHDMLLLTDQSGFYRGDENIRVRGVSVAAQKETQRARQLEFLQLTLNPVDTQIVGPEGRSKLLRSVADTLGLDGEGIVPSVEELRARMQAAMEQPAQPGGGGSPAKPSEDIGPRANMVKPPAGQPPR